MKLLACHLPQLKKLKLKGDLNLPKHHIADRTIGQDSNSDLSGPVLCWGLTCSSLQELIRNLMNGLKAQLLLKIKSCKHTNKLHKNNGRKYSNLIASYLFYEILLSYMFLKLLILLLSAC